MKRLLHLGSYDEAPDVAEWVPQKLASLTAGMQVSWKQRCTTPDTTRELELQCRAAKVDGVVCSNQEFLEKLLYLQPDFIPPPGRKEISLDDYQGSLLFTPVEKIPVVIINPLINTIRVPYAAPAARRFISKLSQPGKWFRATPFSWQLATPTNLPGIYDRFQRGATIIGCDIETIVDDPLRRIACISFAAYFADSHTTECVVIPFTDEFFYHWIKKFCQLEAPKVFQNGLYDNLYLLRWGIPVCNWLHDTQHLFHSMFSEYPKRLDFIAAYSLRSIRYWKDDGKTGNLQDYYRYNALDSWATVNSYLALLAEVEPYALRNYEQEFPLVFPSLTCEIEGFRVDKEQFAKTTVLIDAEIEKDEAEFQQMIAAPNFNSNSPIQKLQLFAVLGLNKLKWIPNPDPKKAGKWEVLSGLGSSNKANMLKAKASTPFNERILTVMTDVIENKKLRSNYLVEEKIWNGRLHYKLNPAGTDTGRLASTASSYWCGFQIQNIPAKYIHVKQFLVADSGWLLCEIDKAQAEARCVGYLSGETKLITAVEGPHDFHSLNCSAFFGVPYETVYSDELHKTLNKTLRDLSKRTNHGANYNMGEGVMLDTMGPKYVSQAKVLLRLSGSLRSVCKFLLDRYAQTYPRVKADWYDSIIKEVKLTGRLLTPTGRTRVFFGKPWNNKRDLNAAVAHKPQSFNVDLLNEEWYNTWRCSIYGSAWKLDWRTGARTRLDLDLRGKVRCKAQIHDSNLFQYRAEYPDIPELVRDKLMDSRILVKAPDGIMREMFIPSDISAGKARWSELK